MEKTLTQDQRISVIRHVFEASQSFAPKQSVKDFIADVKSEEVFAEHGLLENQKSDIEDESSLIEHDPSAESIDEEDQEIGLSEEMRKSMGIAIEREDQLEFNKNAMLWVGSDIKNRPKTDKDWVFYKSGTGS